MDCMLNGCRFDLSIGVYTWGGGGGGCREEEQVANVGLWQSSTGTASA